MIKIASRLAVTAAAASMALAPIAAQANTRAGDSGAVYSSATSAQPGAGRSADGESIVGVPGALVAIIAALIAAGIIIIIDDDDNQSPGTN